MLQNLRPMEIVLIVGILVLLFGAKKLPQLAKSVGESLKILKTEVGDGGRATPAPAAPADTAPATAPAAPATAPAPAPEQPAAPGQAASPAA